MVAFDPPVPLEDLNISIYADGANIEDIRATTVAFPFVSGFTTNPSLMRKAGVTNYKYFAQGVIKAAEGLPISFEVVSEEPEAIIAEAREIASWGINVFVKVPIRASTGEYHENPIRTLSGEGVKLNVTAVTMVEQVGEVSVWLDANTPSVVSVFAGRIADTGMNPVPIMRECVRILSSTGHALLWASPRQLYDIYLAERSGCDIITVGHDILTKTKLIGKDLEEYSQETSAMFYNDAVAAGYKII